MVNDVNIIKDFSSMQNQPVWKPVRTHGSMFLLDVGPVKKRPGDVRDHGEWTLIVEQSSWRFSKQKLTFIDSSMNSKFIDRAFSNLILGAIRKFSVNKNTCCLDLHMDNSITLSVFPSAKPQCRKDDQWLLYTPSGGTWIASEGGVAFESS